MSEHSKGRLKVDGNCYLKDEQGKVVATTAHVAGLPVEKQKANAKELACRWNAFEKTGLASDLLEACVESQKAIMLLYECNPNVEIAVGSALQLSKAKALVEAVITKANKDQNEQMESSL